MTFEHDSLKGRGARHNPHNRFDRLETVQQHAEGIDDWEEAAPHTQYIEIQPKSILSEVKSPDLPMGYSLNTYNGCEHGCTYCYARNQHEYHGYSAGVDFEQKILVKTNAAELLEQALARPGYTPRPLMLSGNTDCYQPAERKYALTRRILQVLLRYRHPVGILTKNKLILRDLDVLQEMAANSLVHARLSITTQDDRLRRLLEPRTSTLAGRLEAVRTLSEAGVPTGVMIAPMIPGLNHHELPALMQAAAQAGALDAGYTVVRLNGQIGDIFARWVQHHYPDRAEKVLGQIAHAHGGQLNDSRYGTRIRGEGAFADLIRKMYVVSRKKYLAGRSMPPFDYSRFSPPQGKQQSLF